MIRPIRWLPAALCAGSLCLAPVPALSDYEPAISPAFIANILAKANESGITGELAGPFQQLRDRFGATQEEYTGEWVTILANAYAEQIKEKHFLRIIGEGVRLRKEPKLQSPIINILNQESIVLNEEKLIDWHRVITTSGIEGFVHQDFVIQEDDLAKIMENLKNLVYDKHKKEEMNKYKSDSIGGEDLSLEQDLNKTIKSMEKKEKYKQPSFVCHSEYNFCKEKGEWFDCELLMAACIGSVLLHGN